jgi:hypothetical protein
MRKIEEKMQEDFSLDSIDNNHLHEGYNEVSKDKKMGIKETQLSSSPPPARKLLPPRKFDFTSLPSVMRSLSDGLQSPKLNKVIREGIESPSRSQRFDRSSNSGIQRFLDTLSSENVEQEKLKEEELKVQSIIVLKQQQLIDSFTKKEEEHREGIRKLKESHLFQLKEIETAQSKIINQKLNEMTRLNQTIEFLQKQNTEKVKNLNDQHYQQLQQQETTFNEKLKETQLRCDTIIKEITEKLETERKNFHIIQKVDLETKEEIMNKKLTKKLLKFEKKVEKVVKTYSEKELFLNGSLQEARHELVQTKALNESKEKLLLEELTIKDKRILLLENSYQEVQDLIDSVKYWKSLSTELASLVIHTCSSVEELPEVLWTGTTPGLFTSVYDELQGIKNRPKSEESYLRKKNEFVIVQRLLLSKCLKYSKVSNLGVESFFFFFSFSYRLCMIELNLKKSFLLTLNL